MKLALCNIVSGDKEYKDWLIAIESAVEYVDSVHITANHSDHKKIKQTCQDWGWDFSFKPWNKDFSEQRNYNFSRVPKDTDYIIWLDSDDYLVGGEHLRKVAEMMKQKDLDTLFLQYWYGCDFDGDQVFENLQDVELHHLRERIIKPGSITWKKRIHETPVEIEGMKYSYSNLSHLFNQPHKQFPIAVLHRGADRDIPQEKLMKRMVRNQDMLELELEDEIKRNEVDPRTILYLMKIYAESFEQDVLNKCLAMGKEYLAKSGWDEERAECYKLMAMCAGKLGDDNLAKNFLHDAIKEWPHNPLYHLHLAEAYYNLSKYKEMKFWMDSAMSIDLDKGSASMQNTLQMKGLSLELFLKWNYHVKKDLKEALKFAEELHKLNPHKETQGTIDYLTEMTELNDACRHLDLLIRYYESKNEEKAVLGALERVPLKMKQLPFYSKLKNRYYPPKKWDENEVCIFANFGNKHFEQWSAKSLAKGIGGSETAVIQLAKEWTKLGYKVTVYGDPGKEAGDHEGVHYRPYFEFNIRDHFNIFIQWRDSSLAGKVKAKKFYVDLHDLWSEVPYLEKIDSIDKIFVKSKYHRSLAPNIEDSKFEVISNGI